MATPAEPPPATIFGTASPDGSADGVVLPPLNVSGLEVRKADLIAALRIYVPALRDITVLDDDRFILVVGGREQTND